ncbi:glycosyltransferase [Methylotenera sp.]|uniref:glycosyltransferase family 2 protein n=1 Tax=Methylotenera sp. TaxID=2051956 RepID=UPI002488BF04|nr:glycosyltransferase [Methylotenera sp.]MDI1298694.1 glycosyltransferase [Methylotenera sp.]
MIVRARYAQYRNQVQSKLTPLPNWGQTLEKLLFLLPRKWVPIALHPASEMQAVDEVVGEWLSTGDAPCFDVQSSVVFKAGWYYLEVVVVRHGSGCNTKLFWDNGLGFSDENAISIPSSRRGDVREVVYLPRGIVGMRWSPSSAIGYIKQSPLLVHRITWLESAYRRSARVLIDFFRSKEKLSASKKLIKFFSLLIHLQQSYLESASRRLAKLGGVSYRAFINARDTLSTDDVESIKTHINTLLYKPLISIVMPIYDPPLDFLRQALDSVLAQHYPYWELCIADDASSDSAVKPLLEEYARRDSRFKITYRETNGHISLASNSALALATGEFVALMDQDDLLPAHALYHVALEINHHPNVELIYSDEDKVDEWGVRSDPYFKSDWNLDLFYSQNFFNHLGVYKKSLLDAIGGFRAGFEGSQDYDLVLRCVAKVESKNIRHIARVLYHWRMHENSTAQSVGNKSYAHIAGLKALAEHVSIFGATVVDGPFSGSYHVQHPKPVPEPLVSLIIPTRDHVSILRACIESICNKTHYTNWEILIVDNQSEQLATHQYFATLVKDKRIKILKFDAPFNYSAINNFAVAHANGEILGFINNDVEVITPQWLDEMVAHVVRADIGAVGARLLYPDDTVQHAGVILGIGGLANHAHLNVDKNEVGYFGRAKLTQNYSAVTGACLLMRKSVFIQAGMFDAQNLPVAFNDVDLCLKVSELGYRNVYCATAELYHHESKSRGFEDTPEKRSRAKKEEAYMKQKWGELLQNDPFYNPNLSRDSANFHLG